MTHDPRLIRLELYDIAGSLTHILEGGQRATVKEKADLLLEFTRNFPVRLEALRRSTNRYPGNRRITDALTRAQEYVTYAELEEVREETPAPKKDSKPKKKGSSKKT